MVLGVGIDLVEVARIEDSLRRYGERFLQRVYTEEERRYCLAKRSPQPSLAARFAAKEAAAKALGTGMGRGIAWRQLEVQREHGKAPQLIFHGAAAALAADLQVRRILLSLTHTGSYAQAIVMLESE